MSFVIRNKHGRFMKRSYDSYNGMWSPYKHQAKTWKTRKGVEAFAKRYADIWRVTNQQHVIEEIAE